MRCSCADSKNPIAAGSCGREFDDVSTLDQGFLNFYFRTALTLLPPTFMAMGPRFDAPEFVDDACQLRPYVNGWHFMGDQKPWNTTLSWGGEREEFDVASPQALSAMSDDCALRGHRRWWDIYFAMVEAQGAAVMSNSSDGS